LIHPVLLLRLVEKFRILMISTFVLWKVVGSLCLDVHRFRSAID